MVLRNLKQIGVNSAKSFEKKRKIRESEVTKASVSEMNIDGLLRTIDEWELKLSQEKS
jgi:hypothetical protein